VAVGHLLLLDRDGVAEVIAVVQAAVALVAVIEEEIARPRRPAVAEDHLLADDVLQDLHGQGRRRGRPDGVRPPAVGVQEHGPEAGARRLGKIDELGRDRLGRPFEARVLQSGRRGLEIDQEMGPVRGPVGVAEIGDDAGRAHQVQIVLGVVEHLGGGEEVLHAAQGVGVAQQGIEPDPVVDGGVLDLPVAPVVVAEGPPLHLPERRLGMARQGPDGPGQGLGAQG
jgi:hypothetical protein